MLAGTQWNNHFERALRARRVHRTEGLTMRYWQPARRPLKPVSKTYLRGIQLFISGSLLTSHDNAVE